MRPRMLPACPASSTLRPPTFSLITIVFVFALGSMAAAGTLGAATLKSRDGSLQLEVLRTGAGLKEIVSVKNAGGRVPVLQASDTETRLTSAANGAVPQHCKTASVSAESKSAIVTRVECEAGLLTRRISLGSQPDVLEVHVSFQPYDGKKLRSIEDRYQFVPARHSSESP